MRNCDDDCPQTRHEAAVGKTGCPISRATPWQVVRFDADKATFDSRGRSGLEDALAFLRKNPQQRLRVTGYADATEGSGAYSMRLSERRARAVRDFLQSQGLDASRMDVESRGVTDPVAPSVAMDGSANNAGVQRNRRVELQLLGSPQAAAEVPSKPAAKLELRRVTFDPESDTFRPDAIAALDKVVDLMKQNPGVRARIEGHTDYLEERPALTSTGRARAVYQYLQSHGIEASRLIGPVGFGADRPAFENQYPDGRDNAISRSMNRRVDISFEN